MGSRRGRRSLVATAAAVLSVSLLSAASAGATASATHLVTPRSLSPGDHALTLRVGTLARSLILHVPPNPALANRPLLLIYHGVNGTAQGTEDETDFAAVADQTGEVVAFLQGYDDSWNEGTGHTPAAQAHVNDVAYTAAVIAKLEGLVSFDHKRIVAVGFSNGALMVEDLGCKLARQLAMIVPVEGELAVSMSATCRPTRPMAVYEVHGTADAAIYYNGGPINGHGTVVLSAPKSVARWAHLDHCAATPATTRPGSSIKLTRYSRCRNHVTVTLRTIIGGVHQWGSNIGTVVHSILPSS
jgi:polyhydroxybutyrate depolymerase